MVIVAVSFSSLADKTDKIIAGITVPANPVTFHQNQNTSSTKNANDKLVSTPHITCSIGVCTEEHKCLESQLEVADARLYEAKHAGKDQIILRDSVAKTVEA